MRQMRISENIDILSQWYEDSCPLFVERGWDATRPRLHDDHVVSRIHHGQSFYDDHEKHRK